MMLDYHFEVLSNGHVALGYLKLDCAEVNVWDPETGQNIKKLKFHGPDIKSCTIVPSGDAVICRTNGKVEIYCLEDQKMFHSFQNDKGPIVAINQQPRHLLQFVHYNVERHPFRVIAHSFSNDGKYIAIGGARLPLKIMLLQS